MNQRNRQSLRLVSLRTKRGFTLLEVLVAIAIFASLSVAAYQVVSQIQRSNELSLAHTNRLKEIQRTLVMLDSDFRQIAQRPFRTNGEDASKQLLVWADKLLDSDEKGILFCRLGWQNPQQQFPRSEVTKVGYRIQDGVLQRVWWRYPDTPAGQTGVVTPLLSKTEKLDIRFYDGKTWLKEWTVENKLPKAISVSVTLHDFGEIHRTYLVASDDKFAELTSDNTSNSANANSTNSNSTDTDSSNSSTNHSSSTNSNHYHNAVHNQSHSY